MAAKDDVADVLSEEFLYRIRGIPSRDHCVQGCLFQRYFVQAIVFNEGKEHYVLGQK